MTHTAEGQSTPAPGVPRGPGVVPPFPAPPVEGRSARVWLGLGIGALVLVLCGGGGVAALIGLVVTTAQALNEQADAAVTAYFTALRERRYDDAYAGLCQRAREAESAAEFTDRVSDDDPIRSFDVGSVSLAASEATVPVDVVLTDGRRVTTRVELVQNQDTGRFEVCGVKE